MYRDQEYLLKVVNDVGHKKAKKISLLSAKGADATIIHFLEVNSTEPFSFKAGNTVRVQEK